MGQAGMHILPPDPARRHGVFSVGSTASRLSHSLNWPSAPAGIGVSKTSCDRKGRRWRSWVGEDLPDAGYAPFRLTAPRARLC
jgi:hypothetical protein